MNGISELAEKVQQPSLAADPAVREKLDLHLLDTIGAWIAAAGTPEGQALIAFRRRMRAAGRASSQSPRDDLATQVTTHVALARLSEIDDIHLQSMTTPGAIVIPTAVTLAAVLPETDTREIGAAILSGYEAMIRLGLAIKGPDVLYRGIWPTYFGAGFATAAVGARMLRLDVTQTAHALALAIASASPSVGQHHAVTTARWLSVGNAARNGLTAAFAAQAGFTAELDVLRSRLFPDVYGIEPDIGAMTEDGLAFSGVSLKPWCAARQTMPATQALREIMDSGIAAAQISEITAYVPPPHLKMIDHGIRPGDRASRLTSLPYQLAIAALQPGKRADLDVRADVSSAEIQSFMTRVKIIGNQELLSDYPKRWSARLVVSTLSTREERRVDAVPGDPERPMQTADVENKMRDFVGSVTGKAAGILRPSLKMLEARSSLLSMMEEIEHLIDPSQP